MAFWNDWFGLRKDKTPPTGSYAATDSRSFDLWKNLEISLDRDGSDSAQTIKGMLEKKVKAGAVSVGIPDIGFKGVRQQLFQRFNLIDLFAIANNNSVVKTAIGSLKQEVFRRGLQWNPAFEYRDPNSGDDYSIDDLIEIKKNKPEQYKSIEKRLREPDMAQRTRFEQLMQNANIYGQTLLELLHVMEDDLNIADDAFLYLSSDYMLGWENGKETITSEIKQLFRLDPVFIEFDTDNENRVGFAHHICLFHRDDLLEIPPDEQWNVEWQGRCPIDGHTTFPVHYRYVPYKGTFGVRSGVSGPDRQALYLVKGEVLHVSKFSPSELYGYSPILSIYEKALSLIGMDRYLYDYFFERQVPQGVVTTVTDNPGDLEVRKEQMLAEVLNNPHYIPWLAVSSKTGQGRTEFVRFAYSLDELQFLPVQEHIERSVSSLYGVPGLFMGYEDGIGGLNNESQQITRLSRGAQLSQSVYNINVLPKLMDAFGITDWNLTLETSEEHSEQFELDLKLSNAQWAQNMVTMGFGARYDQESDEYEIYGEVKPASEQQAEQEAAWG